MFSYSGLSGGNKEGRHLVRLHRFDLGVCVTDFLPGKCYSSRKAKGTHINISVAQELLDGVVVCILAAGGHHMLSVCQRLPQRHDPSARLNVLLNLSRPPLHQLPSVPL